MFKTNKQKIISAIIALVVAITGYGGVQIIGSAQSTTITLAGSSENAVRMPNAFVDASATSTAGLSHGEGGLFQQQFNTARFETFAMDLLSIGGTATSTGHYKLQASFDGTNFFDMATSTSTDVTGTTTLAFSKTIFDITPGLASSSSHYIFNTQGASEMRLVMYGDDLATDPNDGVQAWVTITKLMQNR